MWYRSIKNINLISPRNRIGPGKKQPVKSVRTKSSLSYKHYKSTFTTMAHWRYVVALCLHSNRLLPIIFSPNYIFSLPLPPHTFKLNSLCQTFFQFHPASIHLLHTFLPRFETWRKTSIHTMWGIANFKVFWKLRFRGKGYYLYKSKRNTLSFRFGYSHRVYRYGGIVWFKLMSKTEIFMWGRAFEPIWRFAWSIKRIRPLNQYTSKGIKFIRQITYKKLGKVGSYR